MTDKSERTITATERLVVNRHKYSHGVETVEDDDVIDTGLKHIEHFSVTGTVAGTVITAVIHDDVYIKVHVKKYVDNEGTSELAVGDKQDVHWVAYGR